MSAVSPEALLWNAMRGGLVTRALALAADLGIADALASGPRTVEELARASGADADILYRLLRALASDGIFSETEPFVFRNTETSALLGGDGGWGDFAHLFGGVWLTSIAGLDADGVPTFPRQHDMNFWAWLGAHPEERAAFDRAMQQGFEGRLARLDSIGWRGDETLVDVGGGNGTLVLALLERHPRMQGIVFDLPETARDEFAFGERCTFVAGSFFESVPGGADVYLLSTILHDWDDESAAAILRTIRRGARDDSRLVLLEGVVEPGNGPDGAKWLDLLMLALFGGRERDEAQWRTLLDQGGFALERFGDGVIEARCR
jgi:hypothetical protein